MTTSAAVIVPTVVASGQADDEPPSGERELTLDHLGRLAPFSHVEQAVFLDRARPSPFAGESAILSNIKAESFECRLFLCPQVSPHGHPNSGRSTRPAARIVPLSRILDTEHSGLSANE